MGDLTFEASYFDVSLVSVALLIAVFGAMLVEARRASRNERIQRRRGGIEPPDDVYSIMRLAYPGAFLAMFVEGFWRGAPFGGVALGGVALFVAAKVLKIWAVVALGHAWTFRVIVVPGAQLVVSGPYRWLRHPNYVAVVGEIAGVSIATSARIAGPASIMVFGWLLWKRIRVENRALTAAAR